MYYVFQGLIESLEGESLALDPNIRVIALYDNEEVSYSVTFKAVRIIQTGSLHYAVNDPEKWQFNYWPCCYFRGTTWTSAPQNFVHYDL